MWLVGIFKNDNHNHSNYKMEKFALIIISVLAGVYILSWVVFSFAMLPWGIIPLLGLFAFAIYFFKAMTEKMSNQEDAKYNDKVEP
jgi:hypothetical protein